MTIKSDLPVHFNIITLEDGSIYFRVHGGRWLANLQDKEESNFRDTLESAYQAFRASHPELP